MPVQALQNHVLRRFDPLNFTFYHRDPPKGTSLSKNTRFEPSLVVIGSTVWPGGDAKSTKKERTKSKPKFAIFADPLPVVTHQPNFACGIASRISFLVSSITKIGWKMWEQWGSNFWLSYEARQEGGVERSATPSPRDVWGAKPSAKNIKYARVYHFKKKNSKISFPEGPRENVWGPSRMFPRVPLWLLTGLFPIDLAHRLYDSLLLPHKPWFEDKIKILSIESPLSENRNFMSHL